MQVIVYKTPKIYPNSDLNKILDEHLPNLQENSIVVITSKIVSLCQGNVIKDDGTVKEEEIIKKEADWYYIDENLMKHFDCLIMTIKNDILIANAGVDASNTNGNFVLWPKNLNETTDHIWQYLRQKHEVHNLGVIITDSRLIPLSFGTRGVGISWCGFEAIYDYRSKPDIFGRPLQMTLKNIIDGLAGAAVVMMGEGDEQTPLSIITDIPFIVFQDRPPTPEERKALKITKEEDIYGKMLNAIPWEKGGKGK